LTGVANQTGKKDYLWLHLKELPYFRSILRAVEASYYPGFALESPILDVGCGDGHFAQIAFDEKIDVGLDPGEGPIREAKQRNVYRSLARADAGKMPYLDNYFASAISNSVLEHIPHVEQTLAEVARVLRKGGAFVFCVPNDRFTQNLSVARFFDRLKLGSLAAAYRAFFNRISRHQHTDPLPVWEKRIREAGFELVRHWSYFSPAALRALEWGHYFGLPSLATRALTGRWILAPTRWNLAITEAYARRYAGSEEIPDGTYSFYVAQKG
jgi:ubiquinone/menaquinone biosynthesis C-methylase UbiE